MPIVSNTKAQSLTKLEGLSEKHINKLLSGVFNGTISIFKLPDFLFNYTFYTLEESVGVGFGLPVDFDKGTLAFKKAIEFRNNISMFSGAKTFQEVDLLSQSIFNSDGTKRAFKEFKEIGKQVNSTYNEAWLKAEQNAAFAQAQSAERWQGIEEEKDIFPLLRYLTIGDSVVRPEHAEWDGIVRPVDDAFWNTHMPPNDWGCRCDIEQLEAGEAKVTDINGKPENSVKLFANNPGKNDYIFKGKGEGKHPYFEIDKRFKKAQENNFGFITP